MGWGSEVLICPICLAGVVGGRLWLTGFPLYFCEKYGKLARTNLKNERISRSGGFQACYEIIRGVGGWSDLSLALNLSTYRVLLNPTRPWGKCPIQPPATAGRGASAATLLAAVGGGLVRLVAVAAAAARSSTGGSVHGRGPLVELVAPAAATAQQPVRHGQHHRRR
jgi:hypothetical protein